MAAKTKDQVEAERLANAQAKESWTKESISQAQESTKAQRKIDRAQGERENQVLAEHLAARDAQQYAVDPQRPNARFDPFTENVPNVSRPVIAVDPFTGVQTHGPTRLDQVRMWLRNLIGG